MPSRDNYRSKAKACLDAGEATRDPKERLAMLQVAQGYLKLADHAAARHDRGAAPREQRDMHPEKREVERFGNTLRSVLARRDDRGS